MLYGDDVKAQDGKNTKYWSGKIFDLIYMNDVKIMEWNKDDNSFNEVNNYTNKYEIDKINFAIVTVIDGRNYDFGGNFRNNEITGKLIPYFPTKKYILNDYNSSKEDQLKELKCTKFVDDSCTHIKNVYNAYKSGKLSTLKELYWTIPTDKVYFKIDLNKNELNQCSFDLKNII